MDPRHLFRDERHFGTCVYCGADPESRDHIPPKVFLDKPYPPELPIVDACNKCNTGYSLDEQYVSCFLEAVLCGTTEPSKLGRAKIRRILTENPRLRQRIDSSRSTDLFGELSWEPEVNRIQTLITKFARGHAAYELYPKFEETANIGFTPLTVLNTEERAAFEGSVSERIDLVPEIGSRAFMRSFGNKPDPFEQIGDWIVVQPGRYRYAVAETGGVVVRMVISEYLACAVSWE